MSDEEFVTLDNGDQLLVPGVDPEVQDILAKRDERRAQQEALAQEKNDLIVAKRDQELADPGVPPEKRIF